jgi:hypothetical protein
MPITISLVAEKPVMGKAVGFATQAGGKASVPEPESLDGALNAGITVEDARTALEVATLIFTFGKAALEFLKALRDHLRAEAPNAEAAVGNAADGMPVGVVRAGTDDAELAAIAAKLGA